MNNIIPDWFKQTTAGRKIVAETVKNLLSQRAQLVQDLQDAEQLNVKEMAEADKQLQAVDKERIKAEKALDAVNAKRRHLRKQLLHMSTQRTQAISTAKHGLRTTAAEWLRPMLRQVDAEIERCRQIHTDDLGAAILRYNALTDRKERSVVHSYHQARCNRVEALRELRTYVYDTLPMLPLDGAAMQQEFQTRWEALPDENKPVPVNV